MLPALPTVLRLEVDKATTSIEKTSIAGFVNLHRHLVTHILDGDGSTRARNQGYEASGVEEKLRNYYVRAARRNILLQSLREICLLGAKETKDRDVSSRSRGEEVRRKREEVDGGLPHHLRELCYIVASYLATPQTRRTRPKTRGAPRGESDGYENDDSEGEEEEEDDLMSEDMDQFYQHLPEITECLAKYLLKLEDTITKMVEPVTTSITNVTTNSSNNNNDKSTSKIPYRSTSTSQAYDLPPTLRPLLPPTNKSSSSHHHLAFQTTYLQTALTQTIPTLLLTLLHQHTTLTIHQHTSLTSLIRTSELFTHGTQSRHVLSHTTFLNTVSSGLSLKTRTLNLQNELQQHDGILVRARDTGGVVERLRREDSFLDQRIQELDGVLRGSGSGHGRGRVREDGERERALNELGKEYGKIEKEIERVEIDIEKLEREL